MKKYFSVIVVGAGSMGMATGYYLGKKGIDTLLIDAYDPPHGMGSHHGETRLIRHAPNEGGQYVPLVSRAQELWYELEGESNRRLFHPTGTLIVGEENASFVKDTIAVANQFSLSMEKLNASDIESRWPQFSIPDHFTGFFESSSGLLLNEEAILAYKKLSDSYQVTMQPNTKVTSVKPFVDGVVVETDNKTFYADKVIVSAGAWTGNLLRDLGLPLQTVRKTFGWFETNDKSFQPPMLPCFYFGFENQKYYGFPGIKGSGVKVGRNDSERNIDPDLMKQDFGKYTSDEKDLKYFTKKFLPGAADKFKRGKSCMITKTPDKNFIIDMHPQFENVVIAGGFSGHGFKYSSVIGEILSQLVTNGETPHDISSFSVSRKGMVTYF